MAWQRKIPFGYTVRNGEIVRNSNEEDVVRNIFSRYLLGESYSQIAAAMERQGVRYHQHTPQWNKHMVKRILENQKYLGKDGYPRLVQDSDFLAVQLRREELAVCVARPVELTPVRKKAACMICGAAMVRDTRNSGRLRWHCQNPECGHTLYIGDKRLLDQIKEQVQRLTQMIVCVNEPIPPAPSPDANRIENELKLCFNRADINPDYIKTLIFAAAAERYREVSDPGPKWKMETLIRQVREKPEDETVMWMFFEEAVEKLLIGQRGVEAIPMNALNIQHGEEHVV